MSRPKAKPPVKKPPPVKAARWRGPASSLTPDVLRQVVKHLRKGATRRLAAHLAGTTEKRLENWMRRGQEAIEAGKRSRYTELWVSVSRAEAEYQQELLELGQQCVTDKSMSDKWLRWRLSTAAPKEFTVPREAPAQAGSPLGALFELVKPEQAVERLAEKMGRFLAEHDKARAAAEAPPPAPPEEPARAE